MSDYPWNETTIARLREDWAAGFPTEEMGRRLGCSKNAILGKVHRLGLPGSQSPIRREPNVAARIHKPKPRPSPLPSLAKEVPLAKPPREPRHAPTCEWPLSDGRPWRFCDAPVKPKAPDAPQSAYCLEHHKLCWHKPYARAAA